MCVGRLFFFRRSRRLSLPKSTYLYQSVVTEQNDTEDKTCNIKMTEKVKNITLYNHVSIILPMMNLL